MPEAAAGPTYPMKGNTMQVTQMSNTHPATTTLDATKLAECIEACFECAQTCAACADACLGEDQVADLVACIRANLDCADICAATGAALSRQTAPSTEVLAGFVEACATACKTCGDHCDQHASMHEHCRVCAEACRRCEQACRDLLATLS